MADLDDRGQLILVAAFAIAVTFIALALVVNSAIFTENLATRGETTGGSDALLLRDEVEKNVLNLTESVNENETTGLVATLNRSVEENLSVQSGIQNAERGRIVTVDLNQSSALVLGELQNNDTDDYTNASGTTDWTLATDTEEIRSAQFNVTNVGGTSESSGYRMLVEDTGSSEEWKMTVFEDTSIVNDYNITVRNETSLVSSCGVSFLSGNFTINLTGGQVEEASALSDDCTDTLSDENRSYSDFSTMDISYVRSDEITGNYTMTLANPEVEVGNFNETSPTADVWIDRVNVTYEYETERLRYNTTVPVEPGETDD